VLSVLLLQEHHIDILVTDVVMKNMDGFTLAHALEERRPGVLVLFLSGQPANFEAQRHGYPRCAFLGKPFQKSDLMDAIGDLLQGQ